MIYNAPVSETFALIRVINSLMQRDGQVALLLLLLIRRAEDNSGSGSRFVSNFQTLITQSILHLETCMLPLQKA